MGYHDFALNEVFTSANADLLMLQGVMRFATQAARTTALSGVLAEGLVTYCDDDNQLTYYDGAAWNIISEPKQTWTPTVSQPGSIAKTVNWGWYQRSNGGYRADCKLSITGSGTGGNAITVSTPFTHVDAGGTFRIYDTSLGAYRVGGIQPQSTTLYSFVIDEGAAEYGVAGGDGLSNGDVIWLSITGSY